jgi:antitoxin FitA
MAQLVVRGLEEEVKARLRQRANRHGQSMEEEVRAILRNAAKDDEGTQKRLGSRLRKRFATIGLVDELAPIRGQKARFARFKR